MAMVHGMGEGRSDEWYTPKFVFDALGEKFDLDVASPPHRTHVPCDGSLNSQSLETPWFGFIWMNPPFGKRNGVVPWMDKFFLHGNGIALTPDRTSAPWFWEAWERADLALFTRKIKFERPGGGKTNGPANGTTLWAAGDRAELALRRAADNGFGILATRA